MQIVIDISDEQYEIIKKIVKNQNSVCPDTNSAEKIILNGTPLPKGHGRLIDADKIHSIRLRGISDYCCGYNDRTAEVEQNILDAPTIIEADKGRK